MALTTHLARLRAQRGFCNSAGECFQSTPTPRQLQARLLCRLSPVTLTVRLVRTPSRLGPAATEPVSSHLVIPLPKHKNPARRAAERGWDCVILLRHLAP